jgi:hypothetical protein
MKKIGTKRDDSPPIIGSYHSKGGDSSILDKKKRESPLPKKSTIKIPILGNLLGINPDESQSIPAGDETTKNEDQIKFENLKSISEFDVINQTKSNN